MNTSTGADPVRVVHVVTVPLSLRFITGVVRYANSQGFDCQVICSPGEHVAAFVAETGIAVIEVPMTRAMTPRHDLGALGAICRHLRRLRPRIAHAGTPKGGLLGMIAAWLCGVPVRVYQMRGLPLLTATGWRRRVLWLTEKVACALAHKVICNSPSLRETALAEGLCPPAKAVIIGQGSGQGVDARERFNPARFEATRAQLRADLGLPPEAVAVGFVGRIVRDKGVAELAASWRQLREEFPEARLLLAGDPEPQDPLPPGTLEALQADPRVHLLGFVSNTAALYAALDLVVLPTYREGFPNVLLEAAAMELPVVATAVPGCVDATCDGTTGLLVPAQDSEALTVALRTYLAAPALRRAHGQAGRQWILDHFQQELIWEGILQLYRELLAARGLPVPPAAGEG